MYPLSLSLYIYIFLSRWKQQEDSKSNMNKQQMKSCHILATNHPDPDLLTDEHDTSKPSKSRTIITAYIDDVYD